MKNKHNNQYTGSRPQRKMKPFFIVFCEGETEEAYINFLKREYKLSVKALRVGLSIFPDKIKRYIQAEKIGDDDIVVSFLMFDLDTEDIGKKLGACKESINITSNPSVELWFLLHICEHNAAISTDNCINKLKKSSLDWASYKKGLLSEKQKQLLWNNRTLASGRAKKLLEDENPSSTVYRLIEAMDDVFLQK